MQTHLVQFPRPLKNATLKSFGGTPVPAGGSSAIAGDNDPKLAKTQANEAANVAALAEIRKLLATMETRLQSQAESQQSNVQQFQELAIQLSTQIAAAIVRYEVTHHETRIRELLESFRTDVGPGSNVAVRVNPVDLERLQKVTPEHFTPDSKTQFAADDSISTGDCRIESAEKTVYANYERQIDDIQSRLMESLHDARLERENTDEDD